MSPTRIPQMSIKLLLVDCNPDDHKDWSEERLRQAMPAEHVEVLSNHSARPVFSRWSALRQARGGKFNVSIFPLRLRCLVNPTYLLNLLAFLLANVGTPLLLDGQDKLLAPRQAAWRVASFFLQPFISLLIILRLPYYVVSQLLGNFLLTREDKNDEFVGFGAGKGIGGLVYWLVITRKIKRYGLFGIAHDTHFGMPLGIHNWPIAVFALHVLGFRCYALLSAAMTAAGLGWICVALQHQNMWPLIPLVLLSTYYLFSIFVSTWEVLAWGFASLAVAALLAGQPILGGVFIACVLLCHPGVTMLLVITLGSLVVAAELSVEHFLIAGAISALLTSWWLVAYWRARHKLGRSYMINSVWTTKSGWTLGILYQFLSYVAFAAVIMWENGPSSAQLILLLPPLALILNTKWVWIFSGYTIFNFMWFAGTIFLLVHPSIAGAICFILTIYTSGEMLWPGTKSHWGFDLSPITMGETRMRVRSLFCNLDGRIAFELGRKHEHISWNYIAALGYILADTKANLLNPGYVEVGDHLVFEKYCRHFNTEATCAEFENACQESGVSYVAAATDDFRDFLVRCGGVKRAEAGDLRLSESPGDALATLTVYEVPWRSSLIEPTTELSIQPNEIRLQARAKTTYRVKYTAFSGWRAFQNGRRIPISDAKPGMLIESESDGEIVLKYAFSHYLR
jgi:hypothetical protein